LATSRWVTTLLIAVAVGVAMTADAAAADFASRVTFAGLPVPGAVVTVTQGDASRTTVTDDQGFFRFRDLADGRWALHIEMLGFAAISQEIQIPADSQPQAFALAMLRFDTIVGDSAAAAGTSPPASPRLGATPVAAETPGSVAPPNAGFQRAAVSATPTAASADNAVATAETGDRSSDAADGFLINGSVNNAASSPFAQLPAFGNNRRGARPLYNGGVFALLGNSAWDARPFSFTDQPAARPSYSDAQIGASFGGAAKLPRIQNRANLFLGYQHTANHDATTQSALVPTDAQRSGDFSQTIGLILPPSSISRQAASLLRLYPEPNVNAGGRYNYQAPVLVTTHQDAFQTRMIEPLDTKNQVYGSVSVQRTVTDSGTIFGFVDSSAVSGIDAPINWSHRFSQFRSVRLRYQYTALTTASTPYFANRENVSGEAGVAGNDQDPVNWGPPTLLFSSGLATLTSAPYARNADAIHAFGGETLWNHGPHNVTAGGDYKRHTLNVVSQQNPRGTFSFTGATTGSDIADFLLGVPHTSSIAFGNAEKDLQASLANAYVTDDWRISPTFTANIGVRWDFESPFTERLGRLANLAIAPRFSAATPVTSSLLRPDYRGLQPRLGLAWRPVDGSSLVIRAGYGIYRNTSVYQALTLLLAQQPPLSTTFSVESTAAHPLTLADGFVAPSGTASNTFAVDPDLRVGYAQNWQLLVQRDLPGSLTITATYLGTKGSHLLQEFLPNTYPIGVTRPCLACPVGFVYLTSNGSSNRNAAQLQVRRRLRNGLAASLQYTLSKATDDAAAAFSGVSVNGASIAQDWLDPGAERAPSSFDQRHLATMQVQYTSGVGVSGGTLFEGFLGSLVKGWTVTGQLTAGSGLPLTPVYLTSVPGTGVTGTIRADALNTAASPAGDFYANPAAFAAPIGHWGTAGRNSIRGPAQFALNASVGRSFLWGERFTVDWRIDATNALNVVTYTGVNTIVGSPEFGLPIQANAMRKLQSSVRVRF